MLKLRYLVIVERYLSVYSRRLTQKIAVEDDNENRGILKYFIVLVILFSTLALFSILLIQFFLSYRRGEPTFFTKNNPFMVLIIFLLFTFTQFCIYKLINFWKISTRRMYISLVLFSLFAGVLISVMFFSPPYSDVWSTINGFVIDSWLTVRYTEYFPNNMGLALLYKGIFKVLGRQGWILMYAVNILSVVGIFFFIPKITGLISNETSERIAIQLLFFNFPFIFMVSYLYNDLISLFLTLAAIWLLFNSMQLGNKNVYKLILSGILLGVAYILRTNILICIIGIIIYLVLYIIKEKKFRYSSLLSFIPIVVLFIMNFIFQASLPKIVPNYSTEFAQPAISWIAMAISDEKTMEGYHFKKPGVFNNFESWAFDQYKEKYGEVSRHEFLEHKDERKKIYSDFVKNRISYMVKNPTEAAKFYAQKEVASWGDVSFGSDTFLEESLQSQSKLYDTLPMSSLVTLQGVQSTAIAQFENNRRDFQSPLAQKLIKNNFLINLVARPLVILTLLAVLIFIYKFRAKMNLESLLLIIIFLGGFVFHEFIWETQPRYLLTYFALLIPIASIGLSQLSLFKRTS